MPDRAVEAVRAAALWFEPGTDGLAPLLDAIGDATLVLIGEASHGTHEFYRIRADLTIALIERKGFNLARQKYGAKTYLVGFTTHTGGVTAARDWDEPAERQRVRPSLDASYERLFHDVDMARFLLPLGEEPVQSVLKAARLERAIGVVYKPETERASHYFRARLSDQFDAVIHVDETRALHPLERWSREDVDLPETYPTGV